MARIVSGAAEYQDPGFAFLSGQESGRRYGLAKNEDERRQVALFFDIQQANRAWQHEKLKSQQILNEQAQMGQVRAMQQLAMEQQVSQNPEQAQLREFLGTRKNLTSDEAIEEFDKTFKSLLQDQQRAKEMQAAQMAIERAAGNGLVDGEEQAMRLQSGEDPKAITADLAKMEQKNTLDTMAANKAAEAIAQAEGLIQAIPQGTESRLRAEYLLTEYQNSPMDQKRPGSDQEFLRAVKNALLMEEGEKNAIRQGQIQRAQPGAENEDFEWPETYGERFTPDTESFMRSRAVFPGGPTDKSGTATGYKNQPRTAAMQGHIDKKKAEKAKRYPGSQDLPHGSAPQKLPEGQEGLAKGAEFARVVDELYRQSMSPAKVYAELEARGYDPDDTELAKIFSAVIQEANESASKLRVAGQ